MLYFKHVFGILTLQTGTIVLSSLFIVRNMKFLRNLAWIVMFLFIVYMIVIWLISFYGAYEESQNGITVATILWTIYIIIWLKLVIYSYIDAQAICIEDRCPDVIWLLSNPWHKKQEECNKVFPNSSKSNNQSLYEKKNKPQMYDDRIKIEKKREKIQLVTTAKISHYATVPFAMFEKYKNQSDIKTNEVKLVLKKCIGTPTPHNNQGCMFVSIIVLLLYLQLILFSWMILISYREEIILQRNIANNNN
eukprot:XP_008183093.1 PREDICTED: uncharacterized protein LOC100569975 isoform X2 [Acyrthosiphon pisum]